MARPTTSYVCSTYNLLTPLLTLDAPLPQYEWKLDTDRSPAVEALFNLAKSRLPAALEAKFAAFPAAIIDTHGKDLTVSADPSRQGSPAPSGASAPRWSWPRGTRPASSARPWRATTAGSPSATSRRACAPGGRMPRSPLL